MDCKFVVGQKVICIDDRWASGRGMPPESYGYTNIPVKGRVYTVNDITCFDSPPALQSGPHLRLEECGPPWYFHQNFKPLTDASINQLEEFLKLSVDENFRQSTIKTDKFDKRKVEA